MRDLFLPVQSWIHSFCFTGLRLKVYQNIRRSQKMKDTVHYVKALAGRESPALPTSHWPCVATDNLKKKLNSRSSLQVLFDVLMTRKPLLFFKFYWLEELNQFPEVPQQAPPPGLGSKDRPAWSSIRCLLHSPPLDTVIGHLCRDRSLLHRTLPGQGGCIKPPVETALSLPLRQSHLQESVTTSLLKQEVSVSCSWGPV